MALLRSLWGRGARATAERLPRATGTPRTVIATHTAEREGRIGRRFLPAPGLRSHGSLLHLDATGPTLVRPGDLEDPVRHGLRGVVELTVVLQGAVEHADGLGNRGRLQAPAARLVAAGAGLMSLVGPSRDLRRDGGDLHLLTIRCRQSLPGAVPTVRTATQVVARQQGRSTITTWTGTDGVVGGADGTTVWTVQLAAGSGVDLAAEAQAHVVVAMLRGSALVGRDLAPLAEGEVAVLAADGPRVQLATHLEQDDAAVVLVVATRAADSTEPAVAGEGRLVASSPEEMQDVVQHMRQGGFGTLPSVDG